MQSITYWNRLEPSPRDHDLLPPLAARIHDGMWFLARQWQLGEYRGEDSGSPAWIEVDTTSTRMVALRTANNAVTPFDAAVPLETVAGGALPIDLAMSVELGQTFESMLPNVLLALPFRSAYPILAPTPAELASGDDELIAFRRYLAGRAIDGAKLFQAASASLPSLPSQPPIPVTNQLTVLVALTRWVAHVRELLGAAPGAASPGWNATNLAYEYQVSMGGTSAFEVRPSASGEATWESFSSRTLATPVTTPAVTETSKIACLPANVRFRGMPPRGFWNFDHAELDYAAVDIEPRDLARLVLTDVLALHGDQWYVIPLDQKVGTLMRIDTVLVRDVFGELTLIPPATTPAWSMFRTSGVAPTTGLLFPPTATACVQYGEPVEDVRYVRDEMMNMVWAIEELTPGPLGRGVRGHDRSVRRAAAAAPPNPPDTPRYLVRPPVPEHWIPYLPVRGADGIRLQRIAGTARIAEDAVRAPAPRVQRVVARSRGFLGHTYLWLAAQTDVAPPETTSPVRFDTVRS
jgi:hypothetical protein